jgi:hypothetical protein
MEEAVGRVIPTQNQVKTQIWGDLVIRKSGSTLVLVICRIKSISNVTNGPDQGFMFWA